MTNHKSKTTFLNILEDVFVKDYTYLDVRSKIEIWQALEKLVSGNFKIINTKTQELNSFRLEFNYELIKITLTETDTKPLKFEYFLKLKKPFKLNISLEDISDKFIKLFGIKNLK